MIKSAKAPIGKIVQLMYLLTITQSDGSAPSTSLIYYNLSIEQFSKLAFSIISNDCGDVIFSKVLQLAKAFSNILVTGNPSGQGLPVIFLGITTSFGLPLNLTIKTCSFSILYSKSLNSFLISPNLSNIFR